MNLPEVKLISTIRSLLLQGSDLSAAQLRAATGKSQSSISLALLGLGSEVQKLGAARSTRYALTQDIMGLPACQALRLRRADGDSHNVGTLAFLKSGRLHVRGPGGLEFLTAGRLPWFLTPLQPQGFLGRELARLRPDFPADPDAWSLAQILYMAVNHQSDPPGAFELGVAAGQLPVVQAPQALALRLVFYDELTANIHTRLPAGSSAGGEQPKFTSLVPVGDNPPGLEHCIVKFTPPRGTPFGERWHALLQLEHLANEVLRAHGMAAAQTRLLHSSQRTYLESVRFDRIGLAGKRHVVPASALHDEFVRQPRRHWVASCEALAAQGLLPADDLRSVALCYLFGQYIGNTDMHFGNLSFFVDDVACPRLALTPVYDMLPMMWRPNIHSGMLELDPVRPQPQPAGYGAEAALAREWAIGYWDCAGELPGLSAAMRRACGHNAQRLRSGFAGLD